MNNNIHDISTIIDYIVSKCKAPQDELLVDCLEKNHKQGIKDLTVEELFDYAVSLSEKSNEAQEKQMQEE